MGGDDAKKTIKTYTIPLKDISDSGDLNDGENYADFVNPLEIFNKKLKNNGENLVIEDEFLDLERFKKGFYISLFNSHDTDIKNINNYNFQVMDIKLTVKNSYNEQALDKKLT